MAATDSDVNAIASADDDSPGAVAFDAGAAKDDVGAAIETRAAHRDLQGESPTSPTTLEGVHQTQEGTGASHLLMVANPCSTG